jgi:hypothetical protein
MKNQGPPAVMPSNQLSLDKVKLHPIRVRTDPDRKDTPWRKMSDAALAAAVDEKQGRVAIGFKDAQATDGVDNRGAVLASPAARTEGLALLRTGGVRIMHEFRRIPAVIARTPGP